MCLNTPPSRLSFHSAGAVGGVWQSAVRPISLPEGCELVCAVQDRIESTSTHMSIVVITSNDAVTARIKNFLKILYWEIMAYSSDSIGSNLPHDRPNSTHTSSVHRNRVRSSWLNRALHNEHSVEGGDTPPRSETTHDISSTD
ncbi:hypothetical protein TNCV_3135961 [Trichonephila clavipes]|nr:hypothetical protein TNCV_3135961 [Trichonephila clavipes]